MFVNRFRFHFFIYVIYTIYTVCVDIVVDVVFVRALCFSIMHVQREKSFKLGFDMPDLSSLKLHVNVSCCCVKP